MINRKNIQRAQRVAEKCADGATIQQKKQLYAKEKGLTYDAETDTFSRTDPATESKVPYNPTGNDSFESWEVANYGGKANGRFGKVSGAINNFMDSASAMLAGFPNVLDQSNLTQGLNAGYDAAADMVSKAGPWGAVAGTAMKIGGFASDALTAAGIGTDQITTADKVLDSKFMKLTPVGLINAIGARSTDDFSVDNETVAQVGGSYGGTVSELNDAADSANKKYGLFSNKARKRANASIAQARQRQNDMAAIAKEASDQTELVSAMGDQASNAYAFNLKGGYKQQYMRAAQGGKAPEISKFAPEIIGLDIPEEDIINPSSFKDGGLINEKINPTTGTIEEVQQEWVPDIIDLETFKSGGKIEKQLDAPEIEETTQKNIIPEGALHKNKHNMENAEDLTKKGIPVVDDNHEQQAEIEKNEIIFTKEVTQKLEELYKVYYSEDSTQKEKDEAAIDAGKLLTKEIMLNTDDRTGLIDSLQKGGKMKSKSGEINNDILSFYNNPDLSQVNFYKDSSPRTEGNNIYYDTDEDIVHELHHYLTKNQPNKAYSDFYSDLDDDKLSKMGADMNFIKGNENEYYQPSELIARLNAAKYMTQGQNYDSNFFSNLRTNENKYGQNMRDLLHMFNDDYLTKLFNVYKKGGKIKSEKPSYEEWIATGNPDWMSDNYDLEKAYEVLPFEQLEKWRLHTLEPNASFDEEGADWHLPSIYPLDKDTFIFLKKGRTVDDNPELKYEFDDYNYGTTNRHRKFRKEFEPKFNEEENRWYYIRRSKQ